MIMIQLIIQLLCRMQIKMKKEKREWKYTLMLSDGNGVYFADSLWKLITEIISHRLFHFKRGDGWRD